jgi:hypothetical protein
MFPEKPGAPTAQSRFASELIFAIGIPLPKSSVRPRLIGRSPPVAGRYYLEPVSAVTSKLRLGKFAIAHAQRPTYALMRR